MRIARLGVALVFPVLLVAPPAGARELDTAVIERAIGA
jgi:hypothetical protein